MTAATLSLLKTKTRLQAQRMDGRMANHTQHISKYQARRLIRLTGSQSMGWLVFTGGLDGTLPIAAGSRAVGIAIVRALRELAAQNSKEEAHE